MPVRLSSRLARTNLSEPKPDGSARIDFPWGDGTHSFRLGLGEARELQRKTGVGPERLYARICDGDWLVDDLGETLRLGLVGAGMDPLTAIVLIARYVEERPLQESVKPAALVLLALLLGAENDTVKKKQAEMTNPTR